MTLTALLAQTATVKRYTYTEDSLGNQTRDATPTETTYPCRIEQTDSIEVTVGQSTEVSNWRGFFPSDADIDAEDQVVYDGKTFEVIGPPATETTPRGPHHKVCRFRLVS